MIVMYLALVFLGWMTIYSASYNYEESLDIFSGNIASGKQFVWIVVSLLAAVLMLLIDSRWIGGAANYIYLLVMGLLAVTIVLAPEIKGSRSWLVLGPFSFQPAEFAKMATSLALAKCISQQDFDLKRSRRKYLVIGIIMLPILLVLLQKETGSALVYLSLFLVLFRVGMTPWVLGAAIAAIVLFIVSIRYNAAMLWQHTCLGTFISLLCIEALLFCWFSLANPRERRMRFTILLIDAVPLLLACICNACVYRFNLDYVLIGSLLVTVVYIAVSALKKNLKNVHLMAFSIVLAIGFLFATDFIFEKVMQPHQKVRIEVLLGMTDDPDNAGYNVNQAKISIGSGGLLGRGYLSGTQTKLKYVPEQDTDFIFCTVGEEFGFVGSALLVLFYLYFIVRLVLLAERQRHLFAMVYGYCVASIFFFHVLINLGMVMGIMPVIGIPLPFFSYGGSSLLAFTILLFAFLRMDADRMTISV